MPVAAFLPYAAAALSSASSYFGQRGANEQNMANSAAQMAFQKQMSNTAHQREVRDLEAAGLNPMISVMGGRGASTPEGAAARVESETKDSTSSGATAALLGAQLEKIRAETDEVKTRAAVNVATVPKVEADTKYSLSSAARAGSGEKLDMANIEKIGSELKTMETQRVINHYEALRVEEAVVEMRNRGIKLEADTLATKAEISLMQAHTILSRLEIPRGEAEAKAYRGALGTYGPYMSSLTQGVSSAVGLRQAMRPNFVLRRR